MTARPKRYKIPVYEVRLVKCRRSLSLAEPALANSHQAARTLHAMLGSSDREQFVALFVNGNHDITGAHVIAVGSQQGIVTIDIRTVFRAAIAHCACAVILGHNHPSGNPAPSSEDITTTAGLLRAGKMLNMPILDHVIVTRDPARYHSMSDEQTLPKVTS